MANKFFSIDFIQDVLSQHHWECVFELEAPKNIMERLSVRTSSEWFRGIETDENIRQEFRRCWALSEIYCPHEGINRLAECGVKSLDWELVNGK